MSQPETTPQPEPGTPTPTVAKPNRLARTVANIWFALSLLAGVGTMVGSRFETYGGDAYTGLQNAIARGNIALGWVIIGTGMLTFVVSRRL